MAQKRRKFSPEFWDEAVKMVVVESRPIAEVAREIQVNEGTLALYDGDSLSTNDPSQHDQPEDHPTRSANVTAPFVRPGKAAHEASVRGAVKIRCRSRVTRHGARPGR
ncbi:transposase [Streptomyces sp. NBC_01483]|uniref:transposase n=1 Tax=Streptomyces sp. NBC_01483 TaxID=2903883 RepID=UPI003FCD96D8